MERLWAVDHRDQHKDSVTQTQRHNTQLIYCSTTRIHIRLCTHTHTNTNVHAHTFPHTCANADRLIASSKQEDNKQTTLSVSTEDLDKTQISLHTHRRKKHTHINMHIQGSGARFSPLRGQRRRTQTKTDDFDINPTCCKTLSQCPSRFVLELCFFISRFFLSLHVFPALRLSHSHACCRSGRSKK